MASTTGTTPWRPAPSHPSYPSSHSVWSGAASGVLGLPRDAGHFHGIADEVAESRIMGGIHYRTDCNVGLTLGRRVADAVWARVGAGASQAPRDPTGTVLTRRSVGSRGG